MVLAPLHEKPVKAKAAVTRPRPLVSACTNLRVLAKSRAKETCPVRIVIRDIGWPHQCERRREVAKS